MFVVRFKRPNEEFDVKAFRSRKAALARFRAAQREMIDGDVEACAMLKVEAADPAQAVDLANQGQAVLIQSDLEDTPRRPARRMIADTNSVQANATRGKTR